MPAITERDSGRPGDGGRWRRLGWFLFLYGVGLLATAVLVYGLRSLLPET